MINKKIFYNELKKLSILNSFNLEKEYLVILHEELEKHNFDDKDFIFSIEQIKENENLNKLPNLALFIKYLKAKELSKEDEIKAQFNFMLEKDYDNMNDTTKLIVDKMGNSYGSVWWRIDNDNPNCEPINYIKKEFFDLYDSFISKNKYLEIENKNKQINNLLENLTKNLSINK